MRIDKICPTSPTLFASRDHATKPPVIRACSHSRSRMRLQATLGMNNQHCAPLS
jgi:hypothetical protein